MAKPSEEIPVKILVMCGGRGTRMWPISNLGHPKQFESMLGNKSMFRHTIERVLKGFRKQDIYVATSDKFADFLKRQAPEIPANNFILEPAMRDNLGAIALSTAIINHRHPDSVMIILWGADHVVQNEREFLEALKHASRLAYENEVIVHVDTPPSYPSVHNGWIKIGKKLKKVGKLAVYEFIHQVEKPDEDQAKEFFAAKDYLIHVGYMAARPSLLLSYYQRYAPDAYRVTQKIREKIGTKDFRSTLNREYPKYEKVSVDYGLFEKLPPRTQWELPVDMGWIDVGTWELLYQGLPKDTQGNVIIGEAHLLDTHNSLIISRNKGVVGAIGLHEMIVVETERGLLVCPLFEAPKVKQLFNEIQEKSA